MGDCEGEKRKKTKKKEKDKIVEGVEGYSLLLGHPKFKELGNGRLQCVQTGHELLPVDKDKYSRSKRCRLGLIDYAISKNKPPLGNFFELDPLSRSRLICKLTGDAVNKSEEHLWKHMNGKRFLNRLEMQETGNLKPTGKPEEETGKSVNKKESKDQVKKKKKHKTKDEDKSKSSISDGRDLKDPEFWVPPVDDGGSSEDDGVLEETSEEYEDIAKGAKRMSLEMEPVHQTTKKKKIL